MNTGPLLLRRTSALFVCRSCRQSSSGSGSGLLRRFATTPSATFQSYTLPTQPPPPRPRNADVPESSIARLEEAPAPLPRVHETRPLEGAAPDQHRRDARRRRSEKEAADQTTETSSRPFVSEAEAQQPRAEPAPTEAGANSASLAREKPSSTQPTTTQPQTAPPTAAAAAAATAPGSSASAAVAAATAASSQKSKLRAPRKAAIRLTPRAVERLRRLLDQPNPKLIKVGVRNRGCSGLAYHFEYVDGASRFDEAVEQDGVSVLIDSKALFSIIGSELDWVEGKLSEGFRFNNPNIKEQCGCGESFMV